MTGALERLTVLARHVHPARPLPTYRLLRESQRWSPDELEAFQVRAIRELLAAAAKVPFHARRLADAGLEPGDVTSPRDLEALPLLERADLQREGIERLRVAGRRGVVVSTSGSSGRPLRVLRSLELVRWVEAADLRAREWHGIGMGEPRLDLPGRPMRLRRRLSDLATNSRRLEDTSAPALERIGASLARRPPALVTGVSTGLYLLALSLLDHDRTVGAKAVWSGGSSLLAHRRRAIEAAFPCGVFERYAAWEAGVIAHECPEGRSLHVFAENVVLEVVREDGTPAPPGTVGEAVVTVLGNRAMPIVRYRMGDLVARAHEPCPCGRAMPVLATLAGRSNELLVCENGERLLPERVTGDVMIRAGTVLEFQIVQREDLTVDVRVVQRAGERDEVDRELISTLLDQLVGLPGTTRVERVTALPPGPGGKLRQIVTHAVPGTST